MSRGVAQGELLCAECGGQQVYSPDDFCLRCKQCGALDEVTVDAALIMAAAEERDYPEPDDPPVSLPAETHSCKTCGGSVIFTGPVLSQNCAYCDGPVVLKTGDNGFETMALIPFVVNKAKAHDFARAWVGRRLAAPGDLADVVSRARIVGLYVPFWTFDSTEAVEFLASQKTGSGKYAKTELIRGEFTTAFDDLLVPASPHVTPLIRDGILHEFDPRDLRPYRPGYLAGFAAERHHQTIDDGFASLQADKDILIRNRIKRYINRRDVGGIVFKTHSSGIRYRRILLPVWMLHYSYQGEAMKVVVCGLKGRAFGERPFSRRKLLAYAAALSAAAIALGLAWGMLAAP